LSILGTMLVADGATFMMNPADQIRLWTGDRTPAWYRRVMGFFSEHLVLCRALAATELVAGTASRAAWPILSRR
jgi:hypothetical protein